MCIPTMRVAWKCNRLDNNNLQFFHFFFFFFISNNILLVVEWSDSNSEWLRVPLKGWLMIIMKTGESLTKFIHLFYCCIRRGNDSRKSCHKLQKNLFKIFRESLSSQYFENKILSHDFRESFPPRLTIQKLLEQNIQETGHLSPNGFKEFGMDYDWQ